MADVFDTLAPTEEKGVDISLSIMPNKRDIFDTLSPTKDRTKIPGGPPAGGDVFDRLTPARSTEEMIAIEGGGLKAPGEYTGTWWKDILPSLADPGVWMDPANIGAALGIKPAQKALGAAGEAVLPKSARILGQATTDVAPAVEEAVTSTVAPPVTPKI